MQPIILPAAQPNGCLWAGLYNAPHPHTPHHLYPLLNQQRGPISAGRAPLLLQQGMGMFRLITSEHVRPGLRNAKKHAADLLLGRDVCDGPEAVVLREGVAVKQHPLRQAQLGALQPVG